MSARIAPAPRAVRPAPRGLGRATLRAQFTVVVFLMAFAPNLVLTLMAQPTLPAGTLTLWMLLVAVTCALVGYWLSRVLLRPLSRLQGEVEGGDFSQARADDPAEIVSLRGAFAELVDRLGTEQRRRNAFMATLVHDLKTPLIAAGHLTQALTELPLAEAERREVGAQIQTETARLLTLVQQMADAHRYERADVQIHKTDTDLRALLDAVARRVGPQARARGVALSVHGQGRAPADAAVLERAACNLAENALRYAKSSVELHVTPQGLSVRDDGPGLDVPLSDLAQPFNAQPTTIAGHQYTAGAAGLGLFIARRIAESHGGELHYDRLALHPPSTPLADSQAQPQTAPPPTAQLLTDFTLTLPEVTP